jgi:phenylacetate-CoA ligase
MLPTVLRKVYGTAVIARNLIGQERVPYLPEEQLLAMRDRRVRAMVRYAATTVPFYRDFFREAGLDPQGIRCAEDLELLPLIDKETVRAQPERFLSTSGRARNALAFFSSGTTGVPLQVWHDRYSLLANSAFNARIRAVISSLVAGAPIRRVVDICHPDGVLKTLPQFLHENRFAFSSAQRTFVSVAQPVEHIVEVINACRPEIISGYGCLVEAFFATVAARKLPLHMPKLVIYYSDWVTFRGRQLIEKAFGVPLVSEYSATEAFKIGFLCEKRCGFHLCDDLTHVRIVDREGQTLPRGKVGQVVISNLVNQATVLLNYCLGDIAALSDQPCSCGRTLRLLSHLEGRSSDILWLPGGGFVHPSQFDLLFARKIAQSGAGILQWQLIQHELTAFEFRLATVDRSAFDRAIGGIVDDLRATLGRSATIRTVYCAQRLPSDSDGKFRTIISKVRLQDRIADVATAEDEGAA